MGGGMADLGGEVLPKKLIIKRLQERLPEAIEAMIHAIQGLENDPEKMSLVEAHRFLVSVGMNLNKTEFDNVFEHWGTEDKSTCNMLEFAGDLATLPPGTEPIYYEATPESPNKTHLALSGVSHLEFGKQYKPFPAHWGGPPNCQMKGHFGVVRDLPGGYGKGNGPMEKYVKDNLEHDQTTGTDEYGRKPFPFGNYSVGCNPPL